MCLFFLGEHPDQRDCGDSIRLTAAGCQLFTGELSMENKDVRLSCVRMRRTTQASKDGPWMRGLIMLLCCCSRDSRRSS